MMGIWGIGVAGVAGVIEKVIFFANFYNIFYNSGLKMGRVIFLVIFFSILYNKKYNYLSGLAGVSTSAGSVHSNQ